jgi:PAS domain S-box-containing protein
MSRQGRLAEAPIPMMEVRLATRLISDVSDALTDLTGYRRDELIGSDPTRYLDGPPSPALPLLVSGQILGYETTTTLRRRDGQLTDVHVWAHSLDAQVPPETGLLVIDDEAWAGTAAWATAVEPLAVLGTVDADWRIDRVTEGVERLLGYESARVTGQPVLGVVHPGDVAELLTGLGHAAGSGHSVVVRVRLQGVDGAWRWCRACLSTFPDASGFAFLLTPVSDNSGSADLAQELQERLVRIAFEVQAARALPQAASLPTVSELPGLERLTAREMQILGELRGGRRSSDIARTLNLAQSTVRNHLAAVYRKLGVDSQVSLLAVLNRNLESA